MISFGLFSASFKCLVSISTIIENISCKEFVTVRWGGEEFVLYMPQTDEQKAFEFLESLTKKKLRALSLNLRIRRSVLRLRSECAPAQALLNMSL
ncbi:diguanylate cyclase domain-containing protein [Treponema zioleckii]|uniref:diguanylate cyclase domain-containing protein n=1 Tax=Treponema zioleckii TaxID=331680 RepID=UPI00168B2DC1